MFSFKILLIICIDFYFEFSNHSFFTFSSIKMKTKNIQLCKICSHKKKSFCKNEVIKPKIFSHIIQKFNSLKSTSKQDTFIAKFISFEKSRYTPGTNTTIYSLGKLDSTKYRVCLKSFCASFGVGRRRINAIVNKIKGGGNGAENSRGKNANNFLYNRVKNKIFAHFKKYGGKPSHYSRGKDKMNYIYLSSDLNLSKMHSDYNKQTSDKVSYYIYRKCFINAKVYKFKKPYTDQCDKCIRYSNILSSNITGNERRSIKTKLTFHLDRARKFYNKMKEDIPDGHCKASFDLQQTLPMPLLRTNKAYYSRSVWLYSEGIVIFNNKNISIFYLWNEYQSNRGALQISSILFYFLLENYNKFNNFEFYCDSCPGQNKNQMLFSMFAYFTLKYKRIITVTFPERGHSFLPSDRAFAQVEKKKRTKDKLLIQKDYESIFTQVGSVKVLNFDFKFLDWSVTKKYIERLKIKKIRKIRVITFNGENIGISNNYDNIFKYYKLEKMKREINQIDVKELPGKNNVSEEKQKDVENLLKSAGLEKNKNVKDFYHF